MWLRRLGRASWSIASGGDIVAVQRCLEHSVRITTLNLCTSLLEGGRRPSPRPLVCFGGPRQATPPAGNDAPIELSAPIAPKIAPRPVTSKGRSGKNPHKV